MEKLKYPLCISGMLICWIAMVSILFLSIRSRNKISIIPLNEITMSQTTENFSYYIDNQELNGGIVTISGWAVEVGKVYPYYNYGLDLHEKGVYNNMHLACVDWDSANVCVFPTQLKERKDVTEKLNDGIDYRYCGFQSRFPEKYQELIDSNGLYMMMETPDGIKTLYEMKD